MDERMNETGWGGKKIPGLKLRKPAFLCHLYN